MTGKPASISSREYLLILGTLFFVVSPLLVIVFYAAAALATLLQWRQIRLNKEKIAVGVLILIISLWMWHRKVMPENYSPGTVAFTDYVPPFIFFYIISLVPFSDSESEHFSYALLLTVPQQFIAVFCEKYYHLHGPVQYVMNGVPVIDIFIGPYDSDLAASATLYNPNIFAIYGVIVFAVTFGILLKVIKGVKARDKAPLWLRVHNVFASLCTVLALVMILLTRSRNGLLAVIFIILCYSIAEKARVLIKAAAQTMIIFLLLSIFMLFSLSFSSNLPGYVSRMAAGISNSFQSNTRSDPWGYAVQHARSDTYAFAVQLIKERPLEGWGIGMFGAENLKRSGYVTTSHAHNILLQLAAEIGLPFTILIVCLFSYIFIVSLLRLRRKDSYDRSNILNLDMVFLITVSGVMIMQIFDLALLMTYRLNFLYWICFAVPYSRAIHEKHKP